MKIKIGLGSRRAFSLIELMVVMAIMMMLAGLLMVALPGLQARANRNKVEAFLAELESGLSQYHIDNGIYPPNESSGDREATGREGAAILYKYLSGDFNPVDGEIDNDEKVYVNKLDFEGNKNSKNPRSRFFQGEYILIDNYGSQIRYLCDPPNTTPANRQTVNPTYDIWSIVDTDPADSADFSTQSRYISNYQGQ